MSDQRPDATDRRIAVTGTPGTGKTTATERLDRERSIDVYHLNDLVREHDLYTDRDDDRGSLVADLEALESFLGDWSGIAESHFAHHLEVDRVVVLRCRPDLIETRLLDRGESAESAAENAESEALDLILSEAVERHGPDSVYEIDTTDLEPSAVAEEIWAVRSGTREPAAGTVDFTGYFEP